MKALVLDWGHGHFGGMAPGPGLLTTLRGVAALWWIEGKRNNGAVLLPVIAAVIIWLTWLSQLEGFVSWMPATQAISFSLAIIGPLTAAFACWVAGRSRRHRLDDLLHTTPLPAGWSALTGWLGVVAWALCSYLGCAGLVLLWTALRVTWGEPLLAPLLIGSVTLVVVVGLGFLVGSVTANRFVPALLAVAVAVLFLLPIGGIDQLDHLKMLSPLGSVETMSNEYLVAVDQRVVLPHLRWLAALSLTLLLAAVALHSARWLPRGLLVVSAVVAILFGHELIDYAQPTYGGDLPAIPFEPVCTTDVVTVCLHPAHEALMDETVGQIGALVQPVIGIEGVPTRYRETVVGVQRGDDPTIVPFELWDGGDLDTGWLVFETARGIVVDPASMSSPTAAIHTGAAEVRPADFGYEYDSAQYVVLAWLVDQADARWIAPIEHVEEAAALLHQPWCYETDCPEERPVLEADFTTLENRLEAAMARFSALDPATRRAWLEANFADLRAGQLTLEDLP
jgi:hypothetical protein